MSQPDQIDLTAEEKSYLQALIDAKKVSPRVSDRAKILLLRSEGVSPSEIRRKLHMLSKPVRLCLDKFKEGGLMRALQDDQRSGHPKEISEEAMQWIVQTAKKSPRTLGYEQDLWSIALLHQYVQQHAKEAGFPRLERITSPTVSRIVNQADRQSLKLKRTRKSDRVQDRKPSGSAEFKAEKNQKTKWLRSNQLHRGLDLLPPISQI